jgi:hypothetical protein
MDLKKAEEYAILRKSPYFYVDTNYIKLEDYLRRALSCDTSGPGWGAPGYIRDLMVSYTTRTSGEAEQVLINHRLVEEGSNVRVQFNGHRGDNGYTAMGFAMIGFTVELVDFDYCGVESENLLEL